MVKSSGAGAEFFVFVENFTYSGGEDFGQLLDTLRDYVENVSVKLNECFLKYWQECGENIILESWQQKYGQYMLNTQIASGENQNEEDCVDIETSSTIPEQLTENETTTCCDSAVSSNQLKVEGSEIAEISIEEAHTTAWQNLWEQHQEDIYIETFNNFEYIFRDYCLYLQHTLYNFERRNKDSRYRNSSDTESSTHETCQVSEDLKSLESLGLPKAFESTKQKSKTKSERKRSTKAKYKSLELNGDLISLFAMESSEEESDSEQLNGVSVQKPLVIEDISDLGKVSKDTNVHDSSGDRLHKTQKHNIIGESKVTKKKKKNRKLRKVPDFILEDKKLLRYWRKRFSLFSRFDDGIRLDCESWFSVTPEKIAAHIAKRMECDVIIDAFCGCGGNTIQFAKTCRKVIAIDIDPMKIEMAKHNAQIYGVANKIDFIIGDFLTLCKSGSLKAASGLFMSPPWGGPQYKKQQDYDIESFLVPVGASELMEHARLITENIAIFLPRNSNLKQIIKLAGIGKRCEIEHNYLDDSIIALTAFYGDIITIDNN